MMAEMSDEIHLFLLRDTINSFKKDTLTTSQYRLMFKCWVSGNLSNYLEFSNSFSALSTQTEEEKSLLEEYNKVLVPDRNINMAKKIIEYLNTKETHFVAAGYAHFHGENSIIDLLTNKGYTIKKVEY